MKPSAPLGASQIPLFEPPPPAPTPEELGLLALDEVSRLLLDGAGLILSMSGGKDSQAMLDYAVELLRHLGLDPAERLVLINADLGRMEWDVTEHLEMLAAHYGVAELRRVKPNRELIDSIRRRGKWPSREARYCTSDHKRGPLEKVIRALCRERGWATAIHAMGERAQESPMRRKLAHEPLHLHDGLTRTRTVRASDGPPGWGPARTVWVWHPIVLLTLNEVWARIERSGLPAHPVYAAGMRRLSCKTCIFASKDDLRVARSLDPAFFAEAVALEREIGHTIRPGFSLADLDASPDDGATGPP